MKNRVTIRIAGENYTILSPESASYMQRIAQMVDERMEETQGLPGMSLLKSAVLAACNFADESCKTAEVADNLREQMKHYLDEAESLRRELAETQSLLEEATEPKQKREHAGGRTNSR